ncbi:hypothetical protein GWK47_049938 [Chionoecetes opilio]|uniref:Uncharacterized protein n=1 Tax=Chionoecetes opilio TaxID=41210 RepID=A0A8J4YBB9_CHIOP|nr:hypothetical protein GWK47_049938 [Chionoecetes opilio]
MRWKDKVKEYLCERGVSRGQAFEQERRECLDRERWRLCCGHSLGERSRRERGFFHASAATKNKMLREAFKEKVLPGDKSVRKYTGFLAKIILNGIFKMIQKKVVKINYWKEPKHFNNKSK